MKASQPRTEKYYTLIDDLRKMLDGKEGGFNTAQSINNEFWEELGTHRQRMEEQIKRIDQSTNDIALQTELNHADSIYEATRSYLNKYK